MKFGLKKISECKKIGLGHKLIINSSQIHRRSAPAECLLWVAGTVAGAGPQERIRGGAGFVWRCLPLRERCCLPSRSGRGSQWRVAGHPLLSGVHRGVVSESLKHLFPHSIQIFLLQYFVQKLGDAYTKCGPAISFKLLGLHGLEWSMMYA